MPEPGRLRYGVTITRVFDASPEQVWAEWTEPERFADWFGGADVEVPLDTVTMDVRQGGRWRATMLPGGRGGEIRWTGEYLDVRPPNRLVFTISDLPGGDRAEHVTVLLADLGDGRTEMRFEQRGHMEPEEYDRAAGGWGTFFDRLAERLG